MFWSKLFIPFCFLFLFLSVKAQNRLSESDTCGKDIYVYRLNIGDLQALYLENKEVGEEFLHTYVTRYRYDEEIPELPAGNYILVQAIANRLVYNTHTVDDLQYYFLSDENCCLYLTDKRGNPIPDAKVKLGHRELEYNLQTETYTIKKFRKNETLRIEHQGVYHFIQVQPFRKKPVRAYSLKKFWWGIKTFFTPKNNSRYTGFVVFNKPVYKPADTVRLKAFLATRKGKPIRKSVQLQILNYPQNIQLTTLKPYRPGLFHYEFKLSDSLKLQLDRNYTLALNSPRLKRNYIHENFRLEEYVLKGITLQIQCEKKAHQRQDIPAIFLKVTDENNLAVSGGHYQICVKPHPPYVFLNKEGYIPRILWKKKIAVDQIGEQKLTLPDSIFPPGVSFGYTVHCVYLSPDNERHENSLDLYYNAEKALIRCTETDTGLLVRQLVNGKPDTLDARITGFTREGKEISEDSVQLPYVLRIDGNASYYIIRTRKTSTIYHTSQFQREMLTFQFYRKEDTIRLAVDNPGRYPFWYILRENNSIIAKGNGMALNWSRKAKKGSDYHLQIEYLFGGRIKKLSDQVLSVNKQIDIRLNTPSVIYPGQKTRVDLQLLDYKGKPVSNADVTAYAFTSKFKPTNPYIPSWSEVRRDRFRYFNAAETAKQLKQVKNKMNWDYWKKGMGLEKIEYYKFLYPDPVYTCTVDYDDDITQISPYAVIDGEVQDIQIVKIDNQPYYFHGTEHFPVYSFPVKPGKHHLYLRTSDREIFIDSIVIAERKKTILSVNAQRSDVQNGISVQRLSKDRIGKLSVSECQLLSRYLFSVKQNFGYRETLRFGRQLENAAFLKSGDLLYYLNPQFMTNGRRSYINRWGNSLLTGPFPLLDSVGLYIDGEMINKFEPECGYDYTIRKGYLKLKQWNSDADKLSFLSHAFYPDFNARILKPEDIGRMQNHFYKEYLRSHSFSFLDYKKIPVSTALFPSSVFRLQLGSDKYPISPYLILFFDKNKELREIYPGNTRLFEFRESTLEKMILLFDDDSYYQQTIDLKPDAENYLVIDSLQTKSEDGFSRWLTHFVESKILSYSDSSVLKPIIKPIRPDFSARNNKENWVTGTVYDAFNGEPMPGACIMIAGTGHGTATDVNGNFSLRTPPKGEILFSFVGCKTQKLELLPGADYQVYLEEENGMLNEVVVSGSGTSKKSSIVGAVSMTRRQNSPHSLLAETEACELSPLIILNGIPYAGSLEDIDPNAITSFRQIEPAKAFKLYGFQGANGVLVIDTSAVLAESQPGYSLRHNFHDDAFWQPALQTDRQGKVSFEVTYPDDITSWQGKFIAVADKRQIGYAETSIRSFKAIRAALALPAFILAGDCSNGIGKLNNYLDDTISVKRVVQVEKKISQRQIEFAAFHVDTIPFVAPFQDSLCITYTLEKNDGFFDGEKRSIPVYRPGCAENKGFFRIINADTLVTFHPEPEKGTVIVHAETAATDVFLREIEKIDIYPYLCNEQMASKIKALLTKKKIYRFLNRPFREDQKIEKLIIRLTRNQNTNGLWGWWDRGQSADWISAQVVSALLAAEKEGYPVNFNKQLATEGLLADLHTTYAQSETQSLKKLWLNELMMLKALNAHVDYAYYFSKIESVKDLSLYEKLLNLRGRQIVGLPICADSVMRYVRTTLFGSLYWQDLSDKEDTFRYSPVCNIVQNTLLAYQILRASGGYEKELERIRNYFFEIRENGYWRNTYEASKIIETIFPDMFGSETNFNAKTELQVNDRIVSSFPFTGEFPAGRNLEIRKKGSLPVFFTAYQTHWNAAPQAESKGFKVRSFFLHNRDTVDRLKAGEAVELVTVVNVVSDAEYVMVEIPIPAGCGYLSKEQVEWNNQHREYGKEKVSVFCNRLSRGEHIFKIRLLPRFTGKYHLNPARAMLMYFPTIYGRENMKKTEVTGTV